MSFHSYAQSFHASVYEKGIKWRLEVTLIFFKATLIVLRFYQGQKAEHFGFMVHLIIDFSRFE